MEDEDNFTFVLDDREYFMRYGILQIDDCEFEADASSEIYSLARAYWRSIKKS